MRGVDVQSGYRLFVMWDEPGDALDYPTVARFLKELHPTVGARISLRGRSATAAVFTRKR